MVKKNDNTGVSGVLAIFGVMFLLVLFLGGLSRGCQSTATSTPGRLAPSYDPNSTSEESRQMVRDQMINQGVKPAEADSFTKELYSKEKEHRRTNGKVE